ncbi:MAG TPA: AAA family ATPase [Pirellulales bacterium]|nr:AAA family ATPase [Pirellulales bacterium]
MKIARLELRAFGPFTDLTLDLDAGREGLHLIYGPNEAGKTSTLRALKQFLYGIPNRSTDNFLHAYGDLRIGAALRNGDGDVLECIRRKATKNDLRLADDATALDPARLTRLLGGLDREAFETMFGIDHPTLVAGGREIVKGGGGLGQILFAAGSGIAELRAVQKNLDDAAAALFVPRGSVPKINKNLSEFDKARKAVKEAQLPSSEWEKHDKQLRQARERLGELEAQLQIVQHERRRLERQRDALPLAAQRAELARRLVELGEVQLLPDDFADKRREAVGRLTAAEAQAREAEEALRELDAQLAALGPADEVGGQHEAIERLQNDLGGYRKAQRDLPGLHAARKQREADAQAILAELRPELALDDVESLRLNRRQQIALQNLGNRFEALASRSEQTSEQLAARSRRHAAAQGERQALDAPRDAQPLAAALRRVQGLGRLEEDRTTAAAELADLEAQAETALARLGLWQGSLEELKTLPAPTAETIDRFENALNDAAARLKTLEEQIAKAEALRAELERRIEQLQLVGDVPGEADLDDARRRRESGWRLVREAWLVGKTDSKSQSEFVAAAGGGDLAAAYEQSVRQADDAADRLRREADRVAQRAELAAGRAAAAADAEKLAAERERAAAEQSRVEADWAELWRPFTASPWSPREMRSWDARRQWLVGQSEAIRKQRGALAALDERIERSRGELSQSLVELGEPAAAQRESLAALVERAQTAVERIAAAATSRQKLEQEIAALGRDLEDDRRQADEAQRELAAWRREWQAAVEPLGLPADATPAQTNEVLAQLQQLFVRLQEAASYRERIEGIDREGQQFVDEVRLLVAALAPEWQTLSPEAAADKLIARQRQAVADQGRSETLRKQRQRQAGQLERAKQAAAEARGLLEALCQEARCSSAEELPELERASADARELRRELHGLDERLLALAGGAALEEFLREVEALDADGVPGRLEQLAGQIEQLESERTEANRTIGAETAELSRMDASGAAADAAERAQNLLAELNTDVEQYARLRLAAAVLREAIERYRAKNQGPVLTRASTLFAQLTAGSFSALRADYNEQGEAVLVGIRGGADGKPVAVESMSDGTADQLYLALRLASLETYLDEKEPIPFIVDDILIRFDNDRSAATLAALAALSRRTQVIFFTHHEHLLDLAEQRLKPGEFFVHRLPRAR